MRILLINPNTTESVTRTVAETLRARAGPEVEIVAATGRFGPRYIASRAAVAIASHAALDAFAEHGEGCDAVYLACFGDPGLLALRESARVPVIGMADAACEAAAARGARFAIVTGGEIWRPMLAEFVALIGLADRCAGIRTVAPTGGDIARDPGGAIAMLAAACEACAVDGGADVVILGGAALAGLAARVQPQVRVPVLCSAQEGADAVLKIAATRVGRDAAPMRAAPIDSVGLSPKLAELLARDLRES